MTQVGIRELRHRLREYVARVAAGERFEITVFDRPVAELRPISHASPSFERLVAEGRVTPPAMDDTRDLPPPAPASGGITATDALLAERREDVR
jgi:prevent-host-death family protein